MKYLTLPFGIIGLMFLCSTNFVHAESPMVRLSVDDVTRIALDNNFDIQLAKYDAWIKATDGMKSESIFDTIFNAEVSYREDESARATTFSGTRTVENDYNIGFAKKLPSGTSLNLAMTNARDVTNSTFSTSPVTRESTLELSVVQAMGKNFLGMQDRGTIKLTEIDIENSEFTSLDKLEATVAEVQQAYWDLVLQAERVEIERDMVEQAKKLYDLHQKQLKDGLVEIPDAIASEANYQRTLNRLTLAQNTYQRKLNVVKLLLNRTDLDVVIEPTDKLQLAGSQTATMESLDLALKNRRDFKQAMNLIKARDIQLSMKKNNLWPEINLTASLARNGLGDSFNDAATKISEEDNPNFFAGLTFEIPLENRSARAELKAAELEKARILLNTKYLERRITIEIVDQVRDCNIFREVAQNEIAISDLQIQKLEEEQKRFNLGRSNTDIIIRFQEDVIQARLSAAEAKYRYQTALIDLKRKESTLLSRYWNDEL